MFSVDVHPDVYAELDSTTLLQVEGLKKAFGGQVVFDALDLELSQGEVALLRGENGSGKTTLLNILTGNLEPDTGTLHYLAGKTPRAYHFPRGWWQDINPLDHFTPESVTREGVSRTWQDVRLFNAQTLRDNIAVSEQGHPGENPLIALFAPRLSSRREKRINQKANAMLARLGLAGREQSSADMISLGQSKRVAIARSVAAGARILFLDEPLAGLDRQGIQDVLRLLESLVKKEQVTLVIIEHLFNQRYLEGLVTTDWLLENGQIQSSSVKHWMPGHAPGTTAGSAALQGGSLRDRALDDQSPSQRALPQTQRPPWFQLLTEDGDGVEIIDETLPRGALLTRIRRSGAIPSNAKVPPQPILECKGLVITRGKRIVIGLDEEAKEENNPTGFDLSTRK